MKLFNPILNLSTFDGIAQTKSRRRMSVQGTVNSTFLLLAITVLSTLWTWDSYRLEPSQSPRLILVAFSGCLITTIMIRVNKQWGVFAGPTFCILEGMFLGGLAAYWHAELLSGIFQWVIFSYGTLFCMLLVYKSERIPEDEDAKYGILSAVGGPALVYLLTFLFRLITGKGAYIYYSETPNVIAIFFLIGTTLLLLVEFDLVETAAKGNIPKFMESYGAIGLVFTLLWGPIDVLYLASNTEEEREGAAIGEEPAQLQTKTMRRMKQLQNLRSRIESAIRERHRRVRVYRPSNKVSADGLVTLIAWYTLGGLSLGILAFEFTQIDNFAILVTIGLMFAVGLLTDKAITIAKLRNPMLGLLFGILLTFWVYCAIGLLNYGAISAGQQVVYPIERQQALLVQAGQLKVLYYLFPSALGEYAYLWFNIPGIFVVAGLAAYAGMTSASKPFCEFHNKWYDIHAYLGSIDAREIRNIPALVQAGNYSGLGKIVREDESTPSADVYLECCDGCDASDSLITITTSFYNSANKLKQKDLFRCMLTPGQKRTLLQSMDLKAKSPHTFAASLG